MEYFNLDLVIVKITVTCSFFACCIRFEKNASNCFQLLIDDSSRLFSRCIFAWFGVGVVAIISRYLSRFFIKT